MKEIKFRVWDRFLKRFINLDIIHDSINSIFRKNVEKIFLQYTGLKDYNGKEIYEGDLVKNKLGRICEIYWHETLACWDCRVIKIVPNDSAQDFNTSYWHYLEVIGNIYENPELLNDSKHSLSKD